MKKKCIPCKCGKMIHSDNAKYCVSCGSKLQEKSNFQTKVLKWMLESWIKQD